MKARNVFALSILTASMALAAGCSSDDDDDPDTMTPDTMTPDTMTPDTMTPDTMTPDTMTPDTMPEEDMSTTTGTSILDIARGTDGNDDDDEIDEDDSDGGTPANPDLTTLVSAAGQFPGIVNLLDDETATLTVFAPTNAAFEALGDDAPTGDDLARVLQYHVINGTNLDGTAIANSLTAGGDGVAFETAIGEDLTAALSADGTMVTITDGMGNEVPVVATVEDPINGTVHVIGSVLLPPAATTPDPDDTTTMPPAGGGDTDAPVAGSTFAVIADDDDLSAFETLVIDSMRRESLEADDAGNRAQVVFAPTNAAIDPAITTAVAYTYTGRGTGDGPLEPGDYVGTGAGAPTFMLTGSEAGGDLMVNNLPARFVPTTSGPALYVFGIAEEEDDG